MSQNVYARCAGQSLRLAHHIVSIYDCHIRQKLIVSQRIFHASLLICNNSKRSYLRTCTGRSRNCYKVSLLTHLREGVYTFPDIDEAHCHILEIYFRMLVHYPHDLTCIHCGTAAQCDNYIWLESSHSLCTSLCICQGRIRLNIREALVNNTHLVQLVSNRLGVAIHI